MSETYVREQNFLALYDKWANGIRGAENEKFLWCYTSRLSYSQGEKVDIRISSTVSKISVNIYRDGASKDFVFSKTFSNAPRYEVPPEAYRRGCDWPAMFEWIVPEDAASGGYVIELTSEEGDQMPASHHIFFVRPQLKGEGKRAAAEKPILLIAATSTWAAYNDWGGASYYYGNLDGFPNGFSPEVSIERPWSRGLVWLPEGAPRKVPASKPRFGEVARYESVEWAYFNGYSRQYSSAGWPLFERVFVQWAENEGYQVDIITQSDLEFFPEILNAYSCVVFIGHDEYWSWIMRDNIDSYIENGGNVARFAGNFLWQIRVEDGGSKQVCYKYTARDKDPVCDTDQSHLVTSAWEDPIVGRPGATTFGVNALRGMYASWGGFSPRSARGFIIFRDSHWALEGTGLRYGDMFGDDCGIFGYEVDGLEYTFTDGSPEPTRSDGAPSELQIIAMNWASLGERSSGKQYENLLVRDNDAKFRNLILGGTSPSESPVGAGMIVSFKKGKGEVFTAGTCEWVAGLKYGDPYASCITKNVLDRFIEG